MKTYEEFMKANQLFPEDQHEALMEYRAELDTLEKEQCDEN